MWGLVLLCLGAVMGLWAMVLIWDAYDSAQKSDSPQQAATLRLMAGIPGILLVVCILVATYGWNVMQAAKALAALGR